MTPNPADHVTARTNQIAQLLPELFQDALLQPGAGRSIITGRGVKDRSWDDPINFRVIDTRITTIQNITHVCWLLRADQPLPGPRRSMLTWLLDCLDWISDHAETTPAKRLHDAAHCLDATLTTIKECLPEACQPPDEN